MAHNKRSSRNDYLDKIASVKQKLYKLQIQLGPKHPYVAHCFNWLGIYHFKINDYSEAERYFKHALFVLDTLHNSNNNDIANFSINLAILYIAIGRFANTLPLVERAIELRDNMSNTSLADLAESLYVLAESYFYMGRYAESEDAILKSLEKWNLSETNSTSVIALCYISLGKLQKLKCLYSDAETSFNNALHILGNEPENENVELIEAHSELAMLYYDMGKFGESESLLKRSLKIAQKSSNSGPRYLPILDRLGLLFSTIGRTSEAEEYFCRSIKIKKQLFGENHYRFAETYSYLATLYSNTGRYHEAEKLFRHSLKIIISCHGKWNINVASVLKQFGLFYANIGRHDKAILLHKSALAIEEKALGATHPYIATTLVCLANCLTDIANYSNAESLYIRALQIREQHYNEIHPDIASVTGNLALLYLVQSFYDKAETLLKRTLVALKKSGHENLSEVAAYLGMLAVLYNITKRFFEAEPIFWQSLAIGKRSLSNDDPRLAKLHFNLASFLKNTGRSSFAIFHGKQAVNLLQNVRKNVSQIDRTTLKHFDVTIDEIYKELAKWLIEEGRLLEAHQILDLLKEQEYFEYLRSDSPSQSSEYLKADFNVLEKKCMLIYGESISSLAALSKVRSNLTSNPKAMHANEQELLMIDDLLEKAGDIFRESQIRIANLLAKSDASKSIEIQEADAFMQDLRELPDNVVAIFTVTCKDKLYTLLITPDFRKSFEFDISEKELNEKIFALREILVPKQGKLFDPKPQAEELYKILFPKELNLELECLDTETILWSLDGSLRYLPLDALYDGERYLVERYRNVAITPASRGRLGSAVKSSWTALGLGVTEAHGTFGPLPSVRDELNGIIRTNTSSPAVLEGTIRLDQEFTWEGMKRGLLARHPAVHIASHFHLDPCNETTSFLLLGDGQSVSLDKISNQQNVFADVDLLTLSACNTAVGASGKELNGFSMIAQRQGAKSVVASLWAVDDFSTCILMKEFYKIRESGVLKVEALRKAKIKLLNGNHERRTSELASRSIGGETGRRIRFNHDPSKPYSHPYFWAPFVLIGNYK